MLKNIWLKNTFLSQFELALCIWVVDMTYFREVDNFNIYIYYMAAFLKMNKFIITLFMS